ncbi:alpha/beta hydrolase [Pandoraea iniqua]|uniref:Alpha/beta hydrolase n=1 Tax=Pandoraea iniqua TaxID=2508288 RepID=A0A5E4SWA5_9BURK|nr:patatin-like phospholipase family protein [Pandoraea iniqua]VVD80060.1 alpha/beta hydrolase [Pandoraea iniqua]
MPRAPRDSTPPPLPIDLALQGGGAHGAFTWGVLDRLLEATTHTTALQIEGISGTSAGAMNAAVLATGFARGGPDAARGALEKFWRDVSHAGRFSPLRRTPLDVVLGRWSLDNSPFFVLFDLAARVVSPYDLAPLEYNPLRRLLADHIDFDAIATCPIQLFITATNVRTGRGRVFRNTEITSDVLLATACLPMLYRAIEIDGESYWDGGYAGNPTITPLVRETISRDTILVQVNPVERAEVPRSAREILNRVNEVSFNATLLKELRMIAVLRQVVDAGTAEGRRWAQMRMHRIASDMMTSLGYSSKLSAEWDFLVMLRDEGRRCAETFLQQHGTDLGERSSLDLDALMESI